MSGLYVSVFERARRVADVGALIEQPSRAGWTHLRGKRPCPVCAGVQCFSFKRDAYKCHRSGEGGSAIDLAALIWQTDTFSAACRIVGADVEAERKAYAEANGRKPVSARVNTPRARPSVVRPAIEDNIENVLRDIKRNMKRATNTPAERYLQSRGLPASYERHVLFCPDAPYDVSALWGRGRRLPAMVCEIFCGHAPNGSLHLTYLRADGLGKAGAPLQEGEPRKKMWGPQTDESGEPGGIYLMRPRDETAVLCVAEGVENALSLAYAVGNGAGAFAAGSLDRLQGGMALNQWGKVDWRTPRPDPARPAAIVRHKGPVLIAVDADMNPLVLNPKSDQWRREIPPARRMQVSGVLAAHWWRLAGASDVQVLAPPEGKDLNDLVRESAA